ncbi:LacI family transcriptional regulator [Microlunatus elymi]|uniref:LacI family transcriptional regulator n=1 Tax=Microlunatus elymi TaxID=2596828 RepID=A0A516PWQ0_9ACTN|nr:LacI family DNA-binding transcriptional regulator [Microlunatus elymi]QDP95606.1 LacI family transcriptional regulator [Microlunatus elymi]
MWLSVLVTSTGTPAGAAGAGDSHDVPDPDRTVTIHDVAAKAGVAASTVSRALNNPGRVNATTRERVQRIAAELNYVPSSQARALSSGRTKTVAVLVPDITNPFYFDLIRGTQHQLKAAGYTQVLLDTEESGDQELASLERLRKTCDGVVLSASRLSDEQVIAASRIQPLVTINRNVAGVPSVLVETPIGIAQAVDHLVSLGHRKICYVSGPPTSFSNRWRWRALNEAIRSRRRPGSPEVEALRVGPFSPKTVSGPAAADAVLNSGATACIAYNDLLAIGMLRRFADRKVAVPGDISIVGCDDIFGSDFCDPPLTTMTAPIEQAGRAAITMLLGLLNPTTTGQQPRQMGRRRVMLPTHLTIRSTTGPVRESTEGPA